jgi:hypothetical protein
MKTPLYLFLLAFSLSVVAPAQAGVTVATLSSDGSGSVVHKSGVTVATLSSDGTSSVVGKSTKTHRKRHRKANQNHLRNNATSQPAVTN